MNKHHAAAARRALIERWIEVLNEAAILRARAIERQEGGRKSIEDDEQSLLERPDLFLTPAYELRVSTDMVNLLVEGLWAALAGESDPFKIKPPRGVKPRLSKHQELEAVLQVLNAVSRGENVTEAIDGVAKRRPVSYGTIREAYYDKATRSWADLQRRFSKKRR